MIPSREQEPAKREPSHQVEHLSPLEAPVSRDLRAQNLPLADEKAKSQQLCSSTQERGKVVICRQELLQAAAQQHERRLVRRNQLHQLPSAPPPVASSREIGLLDLSLWLMAAEEQAWGESCD